MTTFVKQKGTLLNYLPCVNLCIDINEDDLGIDQNMYACEGIK
jgi:hypothetical protein